jgi:hypothetical protein
MIEREDFKHLRVGRTRVCHTPSGEMGTVIAPLPVADRERTGNFVVQFDDDDTGYGTVGRQDLEVVEW